jgi:hypothetical protein
LNGANLKALQPESAMKWSRKLLGYSAAMLALLAVFALYTRPDFLVTLANQVWACF